MREITIAHYPNADGTRTKCGIDLAMKPLDGLTRSETEQITWYDCPLCLAADIVDQAAIRIRYTQPSLF